MKGSYLFFLNACSGITGLISALLIWGNYIDILKISPLIVFLIVIDGSFIRCFKRIKWFKYYFLTILGIAALGYFLPDDAKKTMFLIIFAVSVIAIYSKGEEIEKVVDNNEGASES